MINKLKNTIKWLDALPNYKKTVGRLGRKNRKGEMTYCCLGVACNVLGLEDVKYSKGVDDRLMDLLPLRSPDGAFKEHLAVRHRYARYIVTVNDDCLKHDKDFTNIRNILIATLDNWVNDKKILNGLKKHYKKEIAGMK